MRKEIVIIGKSLNEYDFDPRYEFDEDEEQEEYTYEDYLADEADRWYDMRDMED